MVGIGVRAGARGCEGQGTRRAPHLAVGECVARRLRMDSRLEEHLVSNPIAHAADELVLVEEQRLDGARRAGQLGAHGRGRRQLEQAVGRERRPWVLPLRVGAQADPPEAPRVGEGERDATAEHELELSEARGPVLVVHLELLVRERRHALDDKRACHAKMRKQVRRRRHLQPELLAAPPHTDDGLADQCCGEALW